MGSIKFIVVLLFVCTVYCSIPGIKSSSSTAAVDVNLLQVLNASFNALYRYVIQYPAVVMALNDSSANLTVFAPVDSAFNSTVLPANVSLPALLYHVSGNRYMSTNLTDQKVVPTMLKLSSLGNESQVVVAGRENNTWTTINGVRLVLQDIPASNGIVQGIASVLSAPMNTVVDIVSQNFPTLNALVGLSGLDFNIPGLTLFAPTDMAFMKLPPLIVTYLKTNNTMAMMDLQSILEYHGLMSLTYASTLGVGTNNFPTLNGMQVAIDKPQDWPDANASLVINGQAIVNNQGFLATDGVVYGIDTVLVPSSFQFTLEKAAIALGATSFVKLVADNNLTSVIFNPNRTLFLPSNSAIAKADLSKISLYYHAVAQGMNESDLEKAYLVSSMLRLMSLGNQYQLLKVDSINSSVVMVNGVDLMTPTYVAGSYLYLIDSVLYLPESVPAVLQSENYSTLAIAIQHAMLTGNLTGLDSLTVFAPTDDAFENLPPGTLNFLLNSTYSGDMLDTVLENHIVRNSSTIYYSFNIPMGMNNLTTWSGGVHVDKRSNGTTVDGYEVLFPDILAANGVIHGVSGVLIPPSVTFSVKNIVEGLGYTTLIHYLQETNLYSTLESASEITIFAPENEAFTSVANLDSLVSDKAKLTQVLLAHVVFKSIPMLNANQTYMMASNQTLFVDDSTHVELRTAPTGSTIGVPATVLVTSFGKNGYIYGINRVLGTEQDESSGGLKTWQLVLIIVGSVVVALLLLALVVAAGFFVYNTFYKNKNGYRKIND